MGEGLFSAGIIEKVTVFCSGKKGGDADLSWQWHFPPEPLDPGAFYMPDHSLLGLGFEEDAEIQVFAS